MIEIEQPIFVKSEADEHPGCEKVTEIKCSIIDCTFGIIHEHDDIDIWIHEFIEVGISEILREHGYKLHSVEKLIGHDSHIYIEWMNLELHCSMDHVIASILTFTYLPTETGWLKMCGDDFFALLLNQHGRNIEI